MPQAPAREVSTVVEEVESGADTARLSSEEKM